MDWWYGTAGLATGFFALMVFGISGLVRIQVAEVSESRGVSRREARRISNELNDDGFNTASLPAMHAYCVRHGFRARFWFWSGLIAVAILGMTASIAWDYLSR